MTPLFLVTFGRSLSGRAPPLYLFLHFVRQKDAAAIPNAGSKAAFQPNKHI